MFWGDSDLTVVPPSVNSSSAFGSSGHADYLMSGHSEVSVFHFDHSREFFVSVSEEFMEYCSEGALSIEVYGHRSAGLESQARWAERQQLAKSLADRFD
jgi:kinesin family protein 13